MDEFGVGGSILIGGFFSKLIDKYEWTIDNCD